MPRTTEKSKNGSAVSTDGVSPPDIVVAAALPTLAADESAGAACGVARSRTSHRGDGPDADGRMPLPPNEPINNGHTTDNDSEKRCAQPSV